MNAKITMVRRYGVEARPIDGVSTRLLEAPSAGELATEGPIKPELEHRE